MIRVDTHFHPNFNFTLPKRLQRRHARKIWNAFAARKLDVVFVSEHAFHQPVRAYRMLLENRPRDARTHLVPAVEALTKEGIDVIVFSEDTHVYAQEDIITPYALTLEEMVERIQDDPRLFGAIAHPCAPSTSGVLHHRTPAETLYQEGLLNFVEKFNSSFALLERILCSLHLTRICSATTARARTSSRLPNHLIPHGSLALGGSDAHHTWDIGSCLHIHMQKPATYEAIFHAIVSAKCRRTFDVLPHRHPFAAAITDGLTDLREALMRRLGLYRIDPPLTERLA